MSHGETIKNPWPKVFVDVDEELSRNAWRPHYPKLSPELFDPFQRAADFYLLFGIVNDAFCKLNTRRRPNIAEVLSASRKLGLGVKDLEERNRLFRISQNGKLLHDLKLQGRQMFDAVVVGTDEQFVPYVELACGGEIRHHQAVGGNVISSDRRTCWVQWREVLKVYGTDAYTTMARLFREFDGDGFGGEPWAVAAELIRDRLQGKLGKTNQLNKQIFIDRVFTLQHNGGCFLNKLDWANKRIQRKGLYNRDTRYMPSTILKYQSSNPPNILEMFNYASTPVQELVKLYLDTATAEFGLPSGWGKSTVFVDDPTKPSVGIDSCEDSNDDDVDVIWEKSLSLNVGDKIPAPALPENGGWTYRKDGVEYAPKIKVPPPKKVTLGMSIHCEYQGKDEVFDNIYTMDVMSLLKPISLKHRIKHVYPGATIYSVSVWLVSTLTQGREAFLENPPAKVDLLTPLSYLYE